jgi:hypothetical protein
MARAAELLPRVLLTAPLGQLGLPRSRGGHATRPPGAYRGGTCTREKRAARRLRPAHSIVLKSRLAQEIMTAWPQDRK